MTLSQIWLLSRAAQVRVAADRVQTAQMMRMAVRAEPADFQRMCEAMLRGQP